MNLLEVFEASGIDYRLHTVKEHEVFICCPFCTERGETPDRRFRFSINYATGQAHCFNCGKKFREVIFLKRALQAKLDTGEWQLTQEKLKHKAQAPEVKLPEDFIPLAQPGKRTHWDRVALKYLQTRGISDVQVKAKNIGYSMVGDFRYRIVIPVYYKGKLEGIVARAFVQDLEPKYRNSLGNKILYNVPEKMRQTIVLSEGAFDALAIERALMVAWDSAAVLGHTLTERQLEILQHYTRIVIWADPDKAGVHGLIRMGQQLSAMGKQVDAVVPKIDGTPEYDPSDLDVYEIRAKLGSAVPFTEAVEQALKVKLAFEED